MESNVKACSKCGEVKSLHLFNKDKSKKDGLKYSCKSCVSKYQKKRVQRVRKPYGQWEESRREKARESSRKWKERNQEKVSEYNKKRYKNNLEKNKLWKKNNPEKLRIYAQKWKKNNPEKEKRNKKRSRDNLSNHYVRSFIYRMGFPKESITKELIETKRTLIKIHREIHVQ